MRRIWEMDGDGCTTMWMYWYLIPPNCILQMVKIVHFMVCVFYHNKKKIGGKKPHRASKRKKWRVNRWVLNLWMWDWGPKGCLVPEVCTKSLDCCLCPCGQKWPIWAANAGMQLRLPPVFPLPSLVSVEIPQGKDNPYVWKLSSNCLWVEWGNEAWKWVSKGPPSLF